MSPKRRVILFVATSLDGYIARRDGSIDWLFDDQDYGFTPFFASVDTLLMGRATYELSASFPEWPYADRQVVVFTHYPERFRDGRVTFASRAPAEVVQELLAEPGRDIWLVGGGQLVASCMAAGLIDEYQVFVHPIVLGDGLPLYPRGVPETTLELVESGSFETGLVRLTYRRRG